MINSTVFLRYLFINFLVVETGRRRFCFGASRKEVQMKVIHFLIPFYHCDESMQLFPHFMDVANDSVELDMLSLCLNCT